MKKKKSISGCLSLSLLGHKNNHSQEMSDLQFHLTCSVSKTDPQSEKQQLYSRNQRLLCHHWPTLKTGSEPPVANCNAKTTLLPQKGKSVDLFDLQSEKQQLYSSSQRLLWRHWPTLKTGPVPLVANCDAETSSFPQKRH